jgi:hypothetical protein
MNHAEQLYSTVNYRIQIACTSRATGITSLLSLNFCSCAQINGAMYRVIQEERSIFLRRGWGLIVLVIVIKSICVNVCVIVVTEREREMFESTNTKPL